MTTDTPRTDVSRFEALLGSALRRDCIPLRLGQELERELNASQAEIARLRELLNRAIEAIEHEGCPKTANDIQEELARPDPAPEEPANQCRCNNPSIITSTHNGKTYDQCSKCGKKFKITMDEWYGGFSKIESTEVSKLKEMVMDAAKRGDELAAHWKERAEKAEAIIKQLHHLAGIIEGFQNPTK